ncbi:MAG: NusG domain II-containing protein [Clostridium sp.]|nr:NusG domain II-containing protein [Clostridium sp.]MDD7139058.1 NusG domain II-containing protein [Clostridium sp.]MDY6080756.1 NusG domain II-containing protein [Eubacteriales bacterium]
MKRLDFLMIGLAALLSLLPLAFLLQPAPKHAVVTVSQRGVVLYEGGLFDDTVVTTPDGGNTIEIKDGEVRMIAASCKDGLCLSAGIATAAKPIVCLPHELTVRISDGKEAPLDAVTR